MRLEQFGPKPAHTFDMNYVTSIFGPDSIIFHLGWLYKSEFNIEIVRLKIYLLAFFPATKRHSHSSFILNQKSGIIK